MVHHFNLGELKEGEVSNKKELITLIDYIRFYKHLAPVENIDLRNAENLLLNELVNENQTYPYVLFIGREWKDIPCLFLMLHITIIKQSKRHHLALFSLNTPHLDNSDGTYHIHRWFKERIFHPKSLKYMNDEYQEKMTAINIGDKTKLFK